MNIDFRYQSIDIDKEKSWDFDYYLLPTPYAKIWLRSGGLQWPCIHRIELDSSVSDIEGKPARCNRWPEFI